MAYLQQNVDTEFVHRISFEFHRVVLLAFEYVLAVGCMYVHVWPKLAVRSMFLHVGPKYTVMKRIVADVLTCDYGLHSSPFVILLLQQSKIVMTTLN
jgi:hypothetical protein